MQENGTDWHKPLSYNESRKWSPNLAPSALRGATPIFERTDEVTTKLIMLRPPISAVPPPVRNTESVKNIQGTTSLPATRSTIPRRLPALTVSLLQSLEIQPLI